tara:strand:- start:643 stop:1104 length:462 start_codon:yes stop_codon:yes gene_type:complete
MKFESLNIDSSKSGYTKLNNQINSLTNILSALEKRSLADADIEFINAQITLLNEFDGSEKALTRKIRHSIRAILKQVEKSVKIVPKGYYRNLYLAIGMSFGVPLGVVFSSALDNMAFVGIGIPIGMTIGIVIGSQMDEKARKEGRQLDIEVAY